MKCGRKKQSNPILKYNSMLRHYKASGSPLPATRKSDSNRKSTSRQPPPSSQTARVEVKPQWPVDSVQFTKALKSKLAAEQPSTAQPPRATPNLSQVRLLLKLTHERPKTAQRRQQASYATGICINLSKESVAHRRSRLVDFRRMKSPRRRQSVSVNHFSTFSQ